MRPEGDASSTCCYAQKLSTQQGCGCSKIGSNFLLPFRRRCAFDLTTGTKTEHNNMFSHTPGCPYSSLNCVYFFSYWRADALVTASAASISVTSMGPTCSSEGKVTVRGEVLIDCAKERPSLALHLGAVARSYLCTASLQPPAESQYAVCCKQRSQPCPETEAKLLAIVTPAASSACPDAPHHTCTHLWHSCRRLLHS